MIELLLPDSIDPLEFDRLNDAILAVLDGGADKGWVLDLSHVTYMGSAMLGLMVNLRHRVKKAGGKLALCGLSQRLHEIFRTCCMERLFIIARTRQRRFASRRHRSGRWRELRLHFIQPALGLLVFRIQTQSLTKTVGGGGELAQSDAHLSQAHVILGNCLLRFAFDMNRQLQLELDGFFDLLGGGSDLAAVGQDDSEVLVHLPVFRRSTTASWNSRIARSGCLVCT